MQTPIFDFESILRVFVKHEVEFILIGGVCAVLHGAPVHTFDIDLVHSRESENVGRILTALEELEGYYRDLANRKIRPKADVLCGDGHSLLTTNAGPLDLLGTVSGGYDYKSLLPHTKQLKLADDLSIPILNLKMLIKLKEAAGRDKDLAVLPILKSTLEENQRLEDGS
jgi:hypothetical protein